MVSILCTGSNVKRYKRLGYDAKINEYIQVNISDVSRWARCSVNVVCDYCGANYTVAYYSYATHRKIIQKIVAVTKIVSIRREKNLLCLNMEKNMSLN